MRDVGLAAVLTDNRGNMHAEEPLGNNLSKWHKTCIVL
jgi:hypothetical protein